MKSETRSRIDDVSEEQWQEVNKENRKMVEEYLKQSTQLSDQSIKQYTSALRIYFYWVAKNKDNKNFWEIKPRDFLLYQNWLVELGLSSSGIRFKRSSVSSFNNYIETYYLDEYPSFRNYVNKAIALPPKTYINEKNPLTLEEYEKLCSTLEEKELWQQLAYIRFSFSTGARRAEVRQLKKEIISYEPRVIEREDGSKVYSYKTHPIRCKGRGKIGKVRTLQFDDVAMNSLKKWIEIRGEDDNEYVFVSKQNGKYEQVGENGFNSWSETYFEPIVGRRFHPHLLRETRATTLVVEQGKDINVAKKLLGHESSETTQIYVIRKDSDDSDDAF